MSPSLALLSFNLQPSRWMHVSHWGDTAPPGLAPSPEALQRVLSWPRGHRAWSEWLWQAHALSPVLGLDDPALGWGLLPQSALDQLAQHAGLLMFNQRIRHTIAGSQVRELRRAFSADALNFARQQAPRLHPGLQDLPDPPVTEWPTLVQTLGWGLLHQSVQHAAPSLQTRLLWRLPKKESTPVLNLAWSADEVQALVFPLIDLVLPTWLSSFPRPQVH